MGNPKIRVDIPSNPLQKLGLAERVYAKHTLDAKTSPLIALQSHKWEDNGPKIAEAMALHQEAEELQRKANLAYRKRDLLSDEIDESVKSSRDLLLAIFHDNPKEISQWGFDVSDTPKVSAKK